MHKFNCLTIILLTVTTCATQNLEWANRTGGSNSERGYSITLDSIGNIYSVGTFQLTVDFDPGPDSFNLTAEGSGDIYFSKLDPNGNFIWAKAISGPGSGSAVTISLDALGNIYLMGDFSDTADFDTGPGFFNLISNGGGDIFIAKMDNSGNLLWAKSFGGSGDDDSGQLTLDALNNVYTTGAFQGTVDFDPSLNTFNITSSGAYDIFISKLDQFGNLIWAKNMGGISSYDIGQSIALDVNKNIFITGSFSGTSDFDPGSGSTNFTSQGSFDSFIAKLDSSANFLWARSFGGSEMDWGISLTVDEFGNVFTLGQFLGNIDFDPGLTSFILNSAGGQDIFISKLDSSGNFVWATVMGGTNVDGSKEIVLDEAENIYITGYFRGTCDVDPGSGTFNLTSNGWTDFFISKLNSAGILLWAKSFGGSASEGDANEDICNSIAIDDIGNLVATGYFVGTVDFDPSPQTINLSSAGSSDSFVLKLGGTTDIKDCRNRSTIMIWPNPSNGQFMISALNSARISIFNVLGDVIYTSLLSMDRTQIDISSQPTGVYFYQVKEENGHISSGKLLID